MEILFFGLKSIAEKETRHRFLDQIIKLAGLQIHGLMRKIEEDRSQRNAVVAKSSFNIRNLYTM